MEGVGMLFKYFLWITEQPFALKYDAKTGKATIGGHPIGLLEMKSIANDFFKKESDDPVYHARNKVRISFKISDKEFQDGIRFMADNGLRVQATKSLGRIMR